MPNIFRVWCQRAAARCAGYCRIASQRRRLRIPRDITAHRCLAAEELEVRQLLTVTFQPQLSTNVANYSGTLPLSGEINNNPTVNVIFWGPNWSADDQQLAVSEIKQLLSGPFLHALDEYYGLGGDNHVTAHFGASYHDSSAITPGFYLNGPTSNDVSTLEAVISSAIANDSSLDPGNPIDVQSAPFYIVMTDPTYKPTAEYHDGGFNTTGPITALGNSNSTVNIISVGTGVGTGTLSAADMIKVVSHELAEGMTAPNDLVSYLNNTVNFKTGAQFPASNGFGPGFAIQVADGEPEGVGSTTGNRYLYRYLTAESYATVGQAIWSAARQEFVVQDGTAQDFHLTPLSLGPLDAIGRDSFGGTFALTINGDQLPNQNDDITISGDGRNGILVTLNGETADFDVNFTKLSSITVNGGSGSNTLTVDFGGPNSLDLPSGGSFWTASSPGAAMTRITYPSITYNGGGNGQLIITGSPPYNKEQLTPTDAHSGVFAFGGDSLEYSGLGSSASAPIRDDASVLNLTVVDSAGGDTGVIRQQGGRNWLTLASMAPTPLLSFVSKWSVTIDATGSSGEDTFQYVTDGTGLYIPYLYFAGGGKNNVVELAGSTTIANEVVTPMGAREGAIERDGRTIGYSDVDSISDAVLVASLTVKGTSVGETIDMKKGAGAALFGGAVPTLIRSETGTFSDFEFTNKKQVTLHGAGGNDVFHIDYVAVATSVDGDAGNATFDVGDGDLSGIDSTVTIYAGAGASNRLIADGSAGPTVNAVVTSFSITGMAPSEIEYFAVSGGRFGGNSIELLGSEIGDDSFTIASTLAGSNYILDGRGGSDTFVIGAGNLDAIQGAIAIAGGPGNNDRLNVDDSGNSAGVDYTIDGSHVDSVARPGQPSRSFAGVSYDASTEFLRVDGSNAANTFDVTPSLATQFFINGNLPAPGTVSPRNGDYLRINSDSVTGEGLTLTPGVAGSGIWQFASGQKPVEFASIERFNGVEAVVAFSDAGPDSVASVKVFDEKSGWLKFEIPAESLYGASCTTGVRAVVGDMNGDGIPDVIVGPATGVDAVVKIFDGVDGRLIREFRPYADVTKYTGGVELAVGDVDGDGWNDLVVSPGCADKIPVRAFSGNPAKILQQIGQDLWPFDSTRTTFVSVAVADQNVNGAGSRGYIVLGSTVKGISSVESFQYDGLGTFVEVPGSEFQPFGSKGVEGARVATGDVNGDGVQDLIVSEGPGNKSAIRVFDGAAPGVPLSNEFLAYVDAQQRGAMFLGAYDNNGDGRTDVITAFASDKGGTDSILKFNPAGQSTGEIAANIGDFPDVSGLWLANGKWATIVQEGRALVLTNELGIVSEGTLQGSCIVAASDLHQLGVLDQGVIRWNDGTNWQKIDLTGTYVVDGKLAHVQQYGDELRIWNQSGVLWAGSFTSPQTIAVSNVSGLTGQLDLGRIVWSDGSIWKKLDLSETYTNSAGGSVRILDNGGGNLVFVNRAGQGAFGRWISPTQVVAIDWGNVTGTVQDGRLAWSNGTTWNKDLAANGSTALGGRISLQVRPDQILLTNRFGGTSRARLIDANTIYSIDWNVAGTLSGDQILWANGTVWNAFDHKSFHAAFSDVVSFPFPNLTIAGTTLTGGTISIQATPGKLTLVNRAGGTSQAQFLDATTLIAVDWNVKGVLSGNKILWANGTVWKGFDLKLLNAMLYGVTSYPFPT
jgi:hypothetical protein